MNKLQETDLIHIRTKLITSQCPSGPQLSFLMTLWLWSPLEWLLYLSTTTKIFFCIRPWYCTVWGKSWEFILISSHVIFLRYPIFVYLIIPRAFKSLASSWVLTHGITYFLIYLLNHNLLGYENYSTNRFNQR